MSWYDKILPSGVRRHAAQRRSSVPEEFNFQGGSMGYAVGEKFTRAAHPENGVAPNNA